MGHKTAVSRPLPASTLLLDRSTPRVNLIQGRRGFLRLRCISHVCCEFEDPICISRPLRNGGEWVARLFPHFPYYILRCSSGAIENFLAMHRKKQRIKDIYDPANGFNLQIED